MLYFRSPELINLIAGFVPFDQYLPIFSPLELRQLPLYSILYTTILYTTILSETLSVFLFLKVMYTKERKKKIWRIKKCKKMIIERQTLLITQYLELDSATIIGLAAAWGKGTLPVAQALTCPAAGESQLLLHPAFTSERE